MSLLTHTDFLLLCCATAKTQGGSSSAAAAPKRDAVATEEWTCSACSFHNFAFTALCQKCKKGKPPAAISTARVGDLMKASPDEVVSYTCEKYFPVLQKVRIFLLFPSSFILLGYIVV
jgi:hypothetical protein